jgi:hypothetical protein
MSLKKINRQVYFGFAPIFNPEDSSGVNNTWIYDRALEEHLFVLDSIQVSVTKENSYYNGIFAIYDGHEYTHWNQFPGVESRELLGRLEFSEHNLTGFINLNGWECKEFTIGIRSTHQSVPVKMVAILYYYLKKASREELLEYAIKHPVREDTFKRAMRGTTVELEEA